MAKDLASEDIDLRLFRIWMKASRSVFSRTSKDIESHGLRMEQFMLLELLYNKGPHAVRQLSERLAIPSGSITYVVDKLEKCGYVKREPSKTDRRGMLVRLSEEGEARFRELFPEHAALISRLLSAATHEEKRLLAELLKKIGLGAETVNGRD